MRAALKTEDGRFRLADVETPTLPAVRHSLAVARSIGAGHAAIDRSKGT